MRTKVGAHIVQGPRNGYGPLTREKLAAVLAVDEAGALSEAQHNDPETITIYRTVKTYLDAPPGIDQMTVAQARAAADSWYPVFEAIWSKDEPYDYYTVLNEPAGHDASVMPSYIAYEARMAELAEQHGRRLCLLNLAGGTPTLDLWLSYYLPYLHDMGKRGHIYGRHAYGGPLVPAGQDGNTDRPFLEAKWLRETAPDTRMVITEAGLQGGYGYVGDGQFQAQVSAYDQLLLAEPQILAACYYTLGDWNGSNWQTAIPGVIEYMRNAAPPTLPPPPTGQYKKVLHLLPQNATFDEVSHVLLTEGALAMRNTFLFSHDDAAGLLAQASTRADSVLHVWAPSRWTGDVIAQIRALAPNAWLAVPHAGFSSHPLEGMSFPMPLPAGTYTLSSRFGVPRDYDGDGYLDDKHEGLDFAAPMGTSVHAIADGVVEYVGSSLAGYGLYVRVKHTTPEGRVYKSWYAHLSSTLVQSGQAIATKQQIGKVGSTGNSTGPHLHLTISLTAADAEFGMTGPAWAVPYCVDPEAYLDWNEHPGGAIDLLPYLQGDGRVYRLEAHIGGQTYEQTLQTQVSSGKFYQVKDSEWEQLWADSQVIHRGVDTSPGGGRFYSLQGPNGTRWMKRFATVGESFYREAFVQFYRKSDCAKLAENSGPSNSWLRLQAHYPSLTLPNGFVVQDVIELVWTFSQGAAPLETYYYARGWGLVGWKSHTGDWSAVKSVGGNAPTREVIGCL